MPRVPVREQQVSDAALPGVRLQGAPSPSAFGAEIGGTLQRLGSAMYERELQAADRAAVMEAETIAGTSELEILDKMGQMKGRDAVTARDFVDEQFSAVETKLTGALSNDRQRQMFKQVVQHKRDSLNRTALNHATRETEAFEKLTYANNLDQAVNLSRAHAGDDIRIAADKGAVAMKIALMAERQGWDDEAHKTELTKVYSKMNLAAITGKLEQGDDRGARAYYQKVLHGVDGKGGEEAHTRVNEETGEIKKYPQLLQFTAEDRAHVEKALDEGSTRGEAHRQFLTIMAAGTDTAEARRVATNTANAIGDEKVGAMVLQKLDHAFAQEDKRKNEQHQETFANATKLIDEQWKQNPTKTAREMVPADRWAALSIQDRNTLETYLEHARDPGKKSTDMETWVRINSMKDEDLAKVSRSQMMAYVNKLDNGDGDKLLTRWNGVINAKNPDGKKDIKYSEFLSMEDMTKKAMANTGYFDLNTPLSKLPPEQQVLRNNVESAINRRMATIPKDAPLAEKEKAIQEVVDAQVKAQVKVGGIDLPFFGVVGGKQRAVGEFDSFKDKPIRVPLKDIPAGDQDLVKGLLREANKKLDNAKIERIYALKQLRKAGKLDRQALIDQTRKIIEE